MYTQKYMYKEETGLYQVGNFCYLKSTVNKIKKKQVMH